METENKDDIEKEINTLKYERKISESELEKDKQLFIKTLINGKGIEMKKRIDYYQNLTPWKIRKLLWKQKWINLKRKITSLF